MEQQTGHWRELAGIFAAVLVVVAFIAIGFLQMISQLFGVTVTSPGDWGAAMLSLSSAGIGYLIGKQSNNQPSNAISGVTVDAQNPVTVQRTQDEKVTVTPTPPAEPKT